MGFAAGINAGTALVSRALENERAQRAEGRLQSEYDYKVAERAAQDAAVAKVRAPWDDTGGLNTTSPVTNVPPVTDAPPTSVAATGGSGVAPVPPAGEQMAAEAGLRVPGAAVPGAAPTTAEAPAARGAPVPGAAPTTAETPAAAAAAPTTGPGNALGNAPTQTEAPPPAPPKLSREKQYAQDLFNVAKAKKDVAGMNSAVESYHTAARTEIVNDAAKMTDADALDYLHENVNKVGSLPMSVVKEGKDGYRVTAWAENSGKQASALLSSAEVKKLVAADKMMKLGYGVQGLELAGSVDKDLNNVIKEYNTQTDKQVGTGNQAQRYRDQARHEKAQEANSAASVAVSRDRLNMDKKRAGEEKFQNAETFQDKDGNTYKQVFQTNKSGKIESKVFKIGGSDGKTTELDSMPKGVTKVGGSGKADTTEHQVPEPGTKVRVGNTLYRYNDDGSKIPGNGLIDSEVNQAFIKAGIVPEKVGGSIRIVHRPEGTRAVVGDDMYDPKSASDMTALAARVDRLGEATQQVEEGNRANPHNTRRTARPWTGEVEPAPADQSMPAPSELGLRTPGMVDPNRDRIRPYQIY